MHTALPLHPLLTQQSIKHEGCHRNSPAWWLNCKKLWGAWGPSIQLSPGTRTVWWGGLETRHVGSMLTPGPKHLVGVETEQLITPPRKMLC